MISLDNIKCIRPGLLLGEVKKGRFEPSHHLCMALIKDDFKRTICLDEDEIKDYIAGGTVNTTGAEFTGQSAAADTVADYVTNSYV